MSREIKFRAWIKNKNRMENCIEVNPFYIGDCDRFHWKYDEVELMQYTGLKDKNSKKIYEGDIVNIINNSVDEENGYFIVKYDIETARYVLSGNSLVYDFDNTYANECKVIGNIYENPELLEN